MKKMMIVALMSFIGFNASAYMTADQEHTVFECELLQSYPDKGLQLEVVEGGFAGLTRVKIAESLVWGVKKSSVIVRQTPIDPRVIMSQVTYKAKNLTLVISLIDVDGQGTKRGTLIIGNKKASRTEELKCQMHAIAF